MLGNRGTFVNPSTLSLQALGELASYDRERSFFLNFGNFEAY